MSSRPPRFRIDSNEATPSVAERRRRLSDQIRGELQRAQADNTWRPILTPQPPSALRVPGSDRIASVPVAPRPAIDANARRRLYQQQGHQQQYNLEPPPPARYRRDSRDYGNDDGGPPRPQVSVRQMAQRYEEPLHPVPQPRLRRPSLEYAQPQPPRRYQRVSLEFRQPHPQSDSRDFAIVPPKRSVREMAQAYERQPPTASSLRQHQPSGREMAERYPEPLQPEPRPRQRRPSLEYGGGPAQLSVREMSHPYYRAEPLQPQRRHQRSSRDFGEQPQRPHAAEGGMQPKRSVREMAQSYQQQAQPASRGDTGMQPTRSVKDMVHAYERPQPAPRRLLQAQPETYDTAVQPNRAARERRWG